MKSSEVTIRPMLFNLCVDDMSNITPNSNCVQQIDDSTIYRSCKINQKDTFKKELEVDINSVAKWLFETNLVFKTGKTNIYYLEKKNVGMA